MVLVYFRFEGSVADEIPDACIAIDRGALEKQSLLSAMLNPSWNSKQLGGREESPIVVSPLKSLPDWDPAMVSVIVCAQQDQPLILPLGVELEELLRMLDYFQLAPDDCGADVDLTECSIPEGIRARTFVADRNLFATALQHITIGCRRHWGSGTRFTCTWWHVFFAWFTNQTRWCWITRSAYEKSLSQDAKDGVLKAR